MRTASLLLVASLLGACGPAELRIDAEDEASTDEAGLSAPGRNDGGVTIFTVVFENHDYREIVGSEDAPYLNSLIDRYALATNYQDCGIHPSLPNYLCLVSGAPQFAGGADPLPTARPFPVQAQHLGSQLLAAGIPWRAYQESMGTACTLRNKGRYAPKHDPFLYFDDVQRGEGNLCAATNVDLSRLSADLAAKAVRYAFITPNLVNDGHDPALDPRAGMRATDAWARVQLPKLMASDAYRRGGVIFVTWDEAEGRDGHSEDQVPMLVISERLVRSGLRTARPYSHRSYLATVEDLLGLPRLPAVRDEPTMLELFR